MRSVVYGGALAALLIGLTTGMAIKPQAGDTDENGKGPQLVYSTAHGDDNDRGEGWWSVRNGPVGDWVYGTDWLHPKDPPAVYETAWAEPAPVELAPTPTVAPAAYVPPTPTVYTVPSIHGDVRAVSVWRGETTPQDGGQRLEVSVRDDQGRGQIDDAAHRTDPRAQIDKAGAERAPLHRSVELDNPDRAQHANVDDAG